MKNKLAIIPAAFTLFSCGTSVPLTMTADESALINGSPDVMRILTVENDSDLTVLRAGTSNFNICDLNTPEYGILVNKMIRTLESTDGGVGLAAPQIGINRRIVAVMRVDKEGEPIEVYPNLCIVEVRGEKEPCNEGCLSVPGVRADVMRYRDITIEYTDINSDRMDQPRVIREDVHGFAAVIFQHESDHLDGVLFIDGLPADSLN